MWGKLAKRDHSWSLSHLGIRVSKKSQLPSKGNEARVPRTSSVWQRSKNSRWRRTSTKQSSYKSASNQLRKMLRSSVWVSCWGACSSRWLKREATLREPTRNSSRHSLSWRGKQKRSRMWGHSSSKKMGLSNNLINNLAKAVMPTSISSNFLQTWKLTRKPWSRTSQRR